MLDVSKRLMYYKRKDILSAILLYSKEREFAVKYNDYFGKRPDAVFYENEIFNFVKKGATSFHISEERWQNPLDLADLKKDDLNKLRIGWDLILDIDCPYWNFSKLTTHLFVKALKLNGIESITCKFSGNKGFHIGVPFEAFPEYLNNIHIKDWFPEGPKKIASYLVDYISRNFIFYKHGIINFDNIFKISIKELSEMTGKSEKELLIKKCSSCGKTKCVCKKNDYNEYFDSLSIVNVDTILISPRHLFRSPYSLHEKTGLVSVPLPLGKILTFEKQDAIPEKVFPDKLPIFLDKSKTKKNEAEKLLINSFDYDKENIIDTFFTSDSKDSFKSHLLNNNFNENEIPVELFPPCILRILQGLEDGRKRSLFVLMNFLTNMNWNYGKIEAFLLEWNKKNKDPLKEHLIKLQIKYHKQKNEKYLPPNCRQYYQDFSVCQPDNLCELIKNPVQYSKKKASLLNRINLTKKRQRQKLTEEQKEMRRQYREKKKREKNNNLEKK